MKINNLLRYLRNDVNELSEILGDLAPGQQLNEKEIKLIQSRLRSINEEFEILASDLDQNTQETGIKTKDKEATHIKPQQPSEEKKQPDNLTIEDTHETDKVVESEPETDPSVEIEEDNIEQPEESAGNAMEEFAREEIVNSTPIEQREDSGKTIADKYHGAKNSINEKIAMHFDQKDLASKLQQHPIADLTKAIKLNDKIWFINDLFEGNAELYRESIKEINQLEDLESALSFLETNFDFDQDKESFKSFIEFIYRRFLK